MRKLLVLGFVGVGLLAGCGVSEPDRAFFYKENTKYSEANKTLTDCQVEAAQKVPVSNNSYTTPTWTTPVSCSTSYGYTNCYGGNTYGGNLVTQDTNLPLRDRVTEQCLVDKGYYVGRVPVCSNEIKRKMNKKYGEIKYNSDLTDKLMASRSDVECAMAVEGGYYRLVEKSELD